MKVGDLVKFRGSIGVITCVDPEELQDKEDEDYPLEVEVFWTEGGCDNMSTFLLEVLA